MAQECWQPCSTTYPLKILLNIKTDGTCNNHCDLQRLQLKACHQLNVQTWSCRQNNRNEPNIYRIREQPAMPTHSYYDVHFASGNESHSAAGSADEDGELGDLARCTFDGMVQQTSARGRRTVRGKATLHNVN